MSSHRTVALEKPLGEGRWPGLASTREVVPSVRLTAREREVMALIADGMSSQQVADHLFVCKRTIDFHLANIYAKLKVCNRIAACRSAMALGLIPFEPTFAYVS
jgi:ATP/maltotriose-dependent transcriptional regulator MalT